MRITVATMDRAIQAAIAETSRAAVWNDLDEYRALRDRSIYLRGLADAAKVKAADYAKWGQPKNDLSWMSIDRIAGHDAHAAAIRETAKRLRREIKG
jgi:hypothetical protein